MKILYCIAGTCHSGGMERVLANKANYLVAHGYEVVIVTTDQQGQPPFFAFIPRPASDQPQIYPCFSEGCAPPGACAIPVPPAANADKPAAAADGTTQAPTA